MDDPLTFVSPEGVYTQIEEHKPTLAHSYYPTPNAVAPTAYQLATKLTPVSVTFPVAKQPSQAFTSLLGGNKADKHKDKDAKKEKVDGKHQPSLPAVMDKDESVSSGEAVNAVDGEAGTDIPPRNPSPTPADQPHPLLFSPTLGPGLPPPTKKKSTRSKQNLKTTTSSFVTRYQAMEGLNKHLASKAGEVTFLFYNAGKSFYMTEVETGNKLKEGLIRVTFNAWPTCHAVNQSTASSAGLDVLIGFNTGDIMWFDPINTRYLRLNKQGCITSSACTSVRWVPGSWNLFLVSHADGTIVVYDKEREDDPNFTPSSPPAGPSSSIIVGPPSPVITTNGDENTAVVSLDTPAQETLTASPFSFTGLGRKHLHLPSSQNAQSASLSLVSASNGPILPAWDPKEDIWVTRPGGTWDGSDTGVIDKDKEKEMAAAATKNPVSHWRVSKKGIVDFVFSPDVRYVAVVSEDGYLRVLDALNETLVDTYASYFGSLTCVAWSPDGRFIAVGGQDDLVTIFSPHEQRLIARCQGHVSFVASIAFDPVRCDGRTYRFASVGEDCRILLWDFSSGALHRPRLSAAQHHRSSVSSQYSLVLRTMSGGVSASGGRSSFDGLDFSTGAYPDVGGMGLHGNTVRTTKFHPAPSRKEVSLVQPILSKDVEGDLLSSVAIISGSIITASRLGTIKVWSRPPPPVRGLRRAKGETKEVTERASAAVIVSETGGLGTRIAV